MILFNNLPFVMVMTFLLLTLAVGLYYSRRVNTLREYAVGNKDFSTATLVATVTATNYGGGSLIRSIEEIHRTGLYWIVLWLFSIMLIAHYLLPQPIGTGWMSSDKFYKQMQ